MTSLQDKMKKLKDEKDAIILAHYYVNDEIQEIADFVGDSYALAKIAKTAPQKTILFCGVYFMGESAKILSPEKTVLMPEIEADCPMAHMTDIEKIKKIREENEDLAVVCYINSTAETKAYSDVCVTSSNALKIVRNLPQKNIYFIPDENLGRYIAGQVSEKRFIFNDGYCHVHTGITKANLLKAKEAHPEAKVLVHPECRMEILELADYIGSTSGIIDFATKSEAGEFIICTEAGILYELKSKNPDKIFHLVEKEQVCADMKMITLEKVAQTLENFSGQVEVDPLIREKANVALARMLELAE